MIAETTVDLRGCQRCGQNHSQIKFVRLTNPVDEYKYWALCPVNKQPILMAIVDPEPPKEKK